LTVLARVTFSPVDRSTPVGSAAEGGMRAADVHLPARSTRSTRSRRSASPVGSSAVKARAPRSGRNALSRCLARTADWTRARCRLP